jgi:phage protein D
VALPANSFGPARSVYVQLLLDGVEIAGVETAEVGTSNHQISGWFRVDLALGKSAAMSAADFSSMTEAVAEVRVGLAISGLPPAAALWQSLIIGPVDDLSINMNEGTVEISGRDLSALLIDSLTAETFSNQTASEIAQTLALRHGLTPIITTTSTPVGRYYQDGHALSSLYQSSTTVTEWDLLCALAQTEGYDLLIENQNLIFAPPLAETLPAVWQWQPGGNATSTMTTLRMQRSLALARDIVVTVQSWNSRQQGMISQSVRSSANGLTHATAENTQTKATTYVLIQPNLSAQDAVALATQTLLDLSRHERVIIAQMPGELILAPRSLVSLQGTQTEFDQTYIVDEIVRRISRQGGFVQTVRAVNTPLAAAP